MILQWYPTHRHKKHGCLCRVVGLATGQATDPSPLAVLDQALLVAYEDGTRRMYVRPYSDFEQMFEELVHWQ